MPYYKKLVGAGCYLSPCQPEDAIKWAEWFNDLAVTLPLGDEAYVPAGLDRMREDVADTIRQREHVFSIVELQADRLIGRGLLFNVDLVNRSAMLGVVIGEKELWGRGYGQDATRLLLEYAFGLLNLNSIMLGAFSFNERAIQAYRRVGFKEIGRRRQARIIAGRAYDVILMDILAEEFGGGQIARLVEPEHRDDTRPDSS
jgi:RimJ/RimL family protein N-acetyltransferase